MASKIDGFEIDGFEIPSQYVREAKTVDEFRRQYDINQIGLDI
jgi:hypothetical protein